MDFSPCMDTRYRSRTKIDINVDVAMTPTGAWVGFKLPNIFFHVVIWLVQDMKNKRKNLFLLHILFWDQVKHKSILVSLQYYGCRTKFWISFGFWTLAQIWIIIFSVVFWNFGSMRKNIQLIHIIKHLYFPQFFIIS